LAICDNGILAEGLFGALITRPARLPVFNNRLALLVQAITVEIKITIERIGASASLSISLAPVRLALFISSLALVYCADPIAHLSGVLHGTREELKTCCVHLAYSTQFSLRWFWTHLCSNHMTILPVSCYKLVIVEFLLTITSIRYEFCRRVWSLHKTWPGKIVGGRGFTALILHALVSTKNCG